MTKRTERLNSLLKEVISEVVRGDLRNPKIATLITITQVDISPDLHNAKVYVSVIGSKEESQATLKALQSASGFIASHAAKEVTMRAFPHLTFHLDTTAEEQIHIHELLEKIADERRHRS